MKGRPCHFHAQRKESTPWGGCAQRLRAEENKAPALVVGGKRMIKAGAHTSLLVELWSSGAHMEYGDLHHDVYTLES